VQELLIEVISLKTTKEFQIESLENSTLANLLGVFDTHIRSIESELNIDIKTRGNVFVLQGEGAKLVIGELIIKELYTAAKNEDLDQEKVHLIIKKHLNETHGQSNGTTVKETVINTPNKEIKTRSENQFNYINSIRNNDLSFGIGPAGTGKTYLAVAAAIESLQREEVKRIVLVRPAVEAGENLGFLPGDLSQKVDPYLRPMYDALYEMLGFDQVTNLIERRAIELAPLAFMRGRSLNESFIILDEAQNTTTEQMKMFLTRMGFGSKSVVNGDVTQIDLPPEKASGLKHAIEVLSEIEKISIINFDHKDIVRHRIVQKIVEAYEKFKRSR
jgi:phosphate starvation-inducible PhoH-like protein